MTTAKKFNKRHDQGAKKEQTSALTEKASSNNRDNFHIVGIGASAGGLEGLEQFFKNMPPDSGMAFVIVQHLDPTRKSSMPEILSRFTKMPVYLATEGMKIEANSIYLIPPDRYMGIINGALYLEEVAEVRGLRLPVDFFLGPWPKTKVLMQLVSYSPEPVVTALLDSRQLKQNPASFLYKLRSPPSMMECRAALSIPDWLILFYLRSRCRNSLLILSHIHLPMGAKSKPNQKKHKNQCSRYLPS